MSHNPRKPIFVLFSAGHNNCILSSAADTRELPDVPPAHTSMSDAVDSIGANPEKWLRSHRKQFETPKIYSSNKRFHSYARPAAGLAPVRHNVRGQRAKQAVSDLVFKKEVVFQTFG